MVLGDEIEINMGTMANKGKEQNELVMKALIRGKGIGILLKSYMVMT